jgi:hypothetical protein
MLRNNSNHSLCSWRVIRSIAGMSDAKRSRCPAAKTIACSEMRIRQARRSDEIASKPAGVRQACGDAVNPPTSLFS